MDVLCPILLFTQPTSCVPDFEHMCPPSLTGCSVPYSSLHTILIVCHTYDVAGDPIERSGTGCKHQLVSLLLFVGEPISGPSSGGWHGRSGGGVPSMCYIRSCSVKDTSPGHFTCLFHELRLNEESGGCGADCSTQRDQCFTCGSIPYH